MSKPLVAVVGRPNVGKSTFFNAMARRRISIVEDQPGVTRDRIYADVEWGTTVFTLVDTGGLDPKTLDPLLSQMRRQAEIAVETADVILFFVDGREGITSTDYDVAEYLRKAKKPVLLVVNKVDTDKLEEDATEFYALGMGEPIPVSSANLLGLGDLLDAVVALFPADLAQEDDAADAPIQIAVVGRPNVGKSSLVNRLLGSDRAIVSDIPGTTRDAIDTPLEIEGRRYTLIDTAGIRRKARIEPNSLERYSVVRSLGAIRRCDVALLLIDAVDGVTEQDTKIAGQVHESGKACVIVVNKWDAVNKETGTLEKMRRKVLEDLKFMDYAPVLFLSALTGQRVHKLMEMVDEVYAQTRKRVTTGVLNEVLHDTLAVNPPPSDHGRRLRIYYATQGSVAPPTFILFVNDPDYMHYSYERFLENQFRKAFELSGTPVRIILRRRSKEEEGS